MPKLPEFVYLENPDADGQQLLILHNLPPFLVGIVLIFRDADKLAAFFVNNTNPYVKVKGYRIVCTPYSCLTNSPSNLQDDTVRASLTKMADFYLNNRITANEARFNRYKED